MNTRTPMNSLGMLAGSWLLSSSYAQVLRRVAEERLSGRGYSFDVESVKLSREKTERARCEHWCGSLGGLVDGVITDGLMGERDAQRGFVLTRSGKTAIIPVHGILVRHASMVNGSSKPEGVSYAQIVGRCGAAASAGAQNIVLDIDSPGGTVDGAEAMVQDLLTFQERTGVEIHAFAADMAASGAYVVMCACMGAKVCGATASIGSIGVYTVRLDESQMAEAQGVKVLVVSTGPNKGAFVPGSVVEDGQIAALQKEVDTLGEWFVRLVNASRDLNLTLGEAPADGSVYIGREAEQLGLVDGITTMRELVLAVEG